MSGKAKIPSPPYASFSAFMNFMNKLRDGSIPGRIDASVFGNASGSLTYSVIAALKSLHLINQDGVPSGVFVEFVKASDEDRKPIMAELLRQNYSTFFDGEIDLSNATAAQFDEHIRETYDASGSTVDKVASFFILAAKYSGTELSSHILARKPVAKSASSGRSKKQRKAVQENPDPVVRPNPEVGDVASQKELEYQLIDLMTESDIDEGVKQSIWSLVQYLTARKAKKAASKKNEAAS